MNAFNQHLVLLPKIRLDLDKWGYCQVSAGALTDKTVTNNDWLIRRGLAIDTIYPNTKDGQRHLANSNKRKSTSKR